MNPQEQQIIEWGIKNNKTKEETRQAILRFRTTGSPADPNKLAEPVQPKPTFLSDAKEAAGDIKEGFLGVGEQLFAGGERIVEEVQEIPHTKTFGEALQRPFTIGAEAFRTGSRALGEGILAIGKTFLSQESEDKIKAKTAEVAEKVVSTESIQNLIRNYNALEPEQKQNVDNILGFSEGLLDITGFKGVVGATKLVSKGATEGLEFGAKQIKKGLTAVDDVTRQAAEEAKKLVTKQGILTVPKTTDEIVGKVIQAKPKDIPRATRALSNLDTTGVTTYAELGTRIQERTTTIKTALDNFLDQQTGIYKLEDLVVSKTVGDTVVKQNFVQEALTQLQELYTKIQEPANAVRINQLIEKASVGGLSVKEINNIAREYGTEFGRKAFSKMGDPLTSVNAQAYENIRKGVKTTSRDLIEGDTPKILDQRMGDLISTNQKIQKMTDKVAQLYQKVQERGLLERLANKLGTTVDLLTLKAGSGFLSRFLPSNVGLKTMNSIALEEALAQNLKLLDDLLKGIDGGTLEANKIIDEVIDAMESSS